jgi:hypothetical protein
LVDIDETRREIPSRRGMKIYLDLLQPAARLTLRAMLVFSLAPFCPVDKRQPQIKHRLARLCLRACWPSLEMKASG